MANSQRIKPSTAKMLRCKRCYRFSQNLSKATMPKRLHAPCRNAARQYFAEYRPSAASPRHDISTIEPHALDCSRNG